MQITFNEITNNKYVQIYLTKEELEKKNYICTERELTDLFYKQGIKHRFPNKMIDYLDSTFDTLKYDFKDIKYLNNKSILFKLAISSRL